MLVLHYTGMKTGRAALERMCDPVAEVSAHYMVEVDGDIFQLVDEDKRAWHAGVASWEGQSDINSRSIGIEIVNGGHNEPLEDGTLPLFPEVQIDAVIELSQAIIERHGITPDRIVGHSDIAPGRKQDPGEHFPWSTLAEKGIGLYPVVSGSHKTSLQLMGHGLAVGAVGEAVERLREALRDIGYNAGNGETYDRDLADIVEAFQRHWVPDQVTGAADLRTLQMIAAVERAFKTVRNNRR